MDDNDKLSDLSTESDSLLEEDPINNFISNNIEIIIDFYNELKHEFRLCPGFFGNLNSFDITNILIILLFEDIYNVNFISNFNTKTKQNLFNIFKNDYKNEIDYSYSLFSSFLRLYKTSIDIDIWEEICFSYSLI